LLEVDQRQRAEGLGAGGIAREGGAQQLLGLARAAALREERSVVA
jgi:hypothetical protein